MDRDIPITSKKKERITKETILAVHFFKRILTNVM